MMTDNDEDELLRFHLTEALKIMTRTGRVIWQKNMYNPASEVDRMFDAECSGKPEPELKVLPQYFVEVEFIVGSMEKLKTICQFNSDVDNTWHPPAPRLCYQFRGESSEEGQPGDWVDGEYFDVDLELLAEAEKNHRENEELMNDIAKHIQEYKEK